MEVLTVRNQYNRNRDQRYTNNQLKDWSLIIPKNKVKPPQQNQQHQQQQKLKAKRKQKGGNQETSSQMLTLKIGNGLGQWSASLATECTVNERENVTIMNDLSMRLLSELRMAKSRHLTCTEVSIPNDLTMRIAADMLRISEREPCGIRGCTLYMEYEEEPTMISRRIAKLKLDKECVSTFEVYLTLKQDKRGWASIFAQLMKGLSRTVTISPQYKLTKRKLYSHDGN